MTKFQIRILKWIARKIVRQGPNHKAHVIKYYSILTHMVRDEFVEDHKCVLDSFLIECHRRALAEEEL